jgi:uracil-DNA glycosylase family 4
MCLGSYLNFMQPKINCNLCPRLCSFREQNQNQYADWHNAPVESFGDINGELLIVGLAPGLRGANRTGRPFTGDWAGDLLYQTLDTFGFSHGKYAGESDDGLKLNNCRITNAVRCLPPENKPIGAEIATCNVFLKQEILSMSNIKAIMVLGLIAHNATLTALGLTRTKYKFFHGANFEIRPNLRLFSSYHCSRYNTNTKRLTNEMFFDVFRKISTNLVTKN